MQQNGIVVLRIELSLVVNVQSVTAHCARSTHNRIKQQQQQQQKNTEQIHNLKKTLLFSIKQQHTIITKKIRISLVIP